jgi:adenosylcobinamide-GDP ribazoletransferase
MLLDSGRLAVGTLTVLRVRPPAEVDRRVAGGAMVLAPLAVVPVGAAVAVVAIFGHQLDLPALVIALIAVGLVVLSNRALHLDGLSDTIDGLAASYDRVRSLEVMKSGTAGPAGVVGLILVIGVQAASLSALLSRPRWWQAAVLAGVVVCVSRAALTLTCLRGVPPARADGLGLTYTQTVTRPVALVVWAICAAALAGVGSWAGLAWWRGALAALISVVVVGLLVTRTVARFGGVTGDVFGAAIELCLAAGLVVLS